MVDNGQFVAGGMPICEIVNVSKLKIWVKVPEKDIFNIYKGQPVSIVVPALPGKTFTGQINSIGEKADASMRFDAEVLMDNQKGNIHLKAGLFAEVAIPVQSSECMIIDTKALVGSRQNPSVFVIEGGKAKKRDIVTNASDDNYIEVVGGLSTNDEVVVSGQLNLNDGNQVKIIQ